MKINPRKTTFYAIIAATVVALGIIVYGRDSFYRRDSWKNDFVNPPARFRPQPFWHLNGHLTTEGIRKQVQDAYRKDGFGGVAILPLSPEKSWTNGEMTPGTTPEYMTEGYFERYEDILECSAEQGTEVILYDDINFPSGTAWNRIRDEFPHLTKKQLSMRERDFTGPATVTETIPVHGQFMGVVAMNVETGERIDLTDLVQDSTLRWNVPQGKWKLMAFTLELAGSSKIDYMDTTAVRTFISLTYDRYAERFSDFFGNTITKTFFDDVGCYPNRCWNIGMSELFEKRYGKKAVLYYPALWYDIGPETQAARVAFFGLRAELMGEGFPRMVAQWCNAHGLASMGHPPGNYEPTAVDMYGDPFKFYRHTQVPLMDAIHGYPFGRSGFKLTSSAAEAFDRPVTAAECYGNYPADMDSLMLYRLAMELMARGVNFFVPHGMWYDTEQVKIPPLISHDSKLLGPALHRYSDYVGRSVALLDGGRRVTDIALLYPIHSLEAWHGFMPGRPDTGKDVPPENNYNTLSDWLTGELRQDFTFVHPELLQGNLYSVHDGRLVLNTRQTRQEYRLLILPAGKVISAETLKRIKEFYDKGGRILATGQLPVQSAEFGRDTEITALIGQIFGIDPTLPMPAKETSAANKQGGRTIFVPAVTRETLRTAIARLVPSPDVRIPLLADMKAPADSLGGPLGVLRDHPLTPEMLGMFSYIHKQKEGRDIYLFANSTNRPVDTWVEVRGKHRLDRWDPYTGEIVPWPETETVTNAAGEKYTRLHLTLDPVRSVFAVSR